MERYKTRPGVVRTSVCGEHLLVSAKAAREFCPYVTVINESSAFLWDQLARGASAEELEAAVREEFEIEDPAQARDAILDFIHTMEQAGYLLRVEQGGCHEE